MDLGTWMKEFGAAITVCDKDGIILEMNERSGATFKKDGGPGLVGKSLLDCHPEPARSKLVQLLKTQGTNAYTIEKAGVKKLIYQAPWYVKGEFRGLVELSLVIPLEMPHFVRAPKVP
ncbi:MAG TPA: hypothetical protein VGK67_06175 [Myxococcales bacterium]